MQRNRLVLVSLSAVLSLATIRSSVAQAIFLNPDKPLQKSMRKSLSVHPAIITSQQLNSSFGRPPDPTPISTHEKFATFMADENFKSVLLLQNLRPDLPITFRPTLIVTSGEVPLGLVTVPAHSRSTLDINAALQQHGIRDTRGAVAVQFDFSSYGPGSIVVQTSDDKNHLYLSSYGQSAEEYWSDTQYDAVVWAPTEDTTGFIAITNSSTVTHSVDVNFFSSGRSRHAEQVTVAPRHTRWVSIDGLLSESRGEGAGIHVSYTQASTEEYPGAILVEGQTFNKRTGFAKNIHFMDKALPPTPTLRSHFLLLGKQPAEDNFPADVSFHSVVAVRNLENAPITFTPNVRFIRNQVTQTVTLPARSIKANGSLLIDFNEDQRAGHLPADFSQGSLELIPKTANPSIVAELFNISQSGGFVIGPSFTSYPTRSTSSIWRTDGTFQTTIMIENTADKPDRVTMNLFSEEAQYKKSFPIAAGELLKINLRDLQQNGLPDDDGKILTAVSGLMSLTGDRGAQSKLSYDKIVHSTDESDYVGLPVNACDFVTAIGMWIDTSSSPPFPVNKTYYWTQSGPVDESAFGSTSSNNSLAQISNNGTTDLVTVTFPDDGLVHSFTLGPPTPFETVTFCDACSGGDVSVQAVSLSGKKQPLISSTCEINPNTNEPALVASWGVLGGCALSDVSPPLPSGGSCVTLVGKNCYQISTPTCSQTFCAGNSRTIDTSCFSFLDQFPITGSTVPAGCSR